MWLSSPHITDRKQKLPETWYCKICGNCSHMTIKQLTDEITDILNMLINNPNLIENPISIEELHNPEIARMENDIQEILQGIIER